MARAEFYCGDYKEVLCQIELPTKVAIITDPPYGSKTDTNYFRFVGLSRKHSNFGRIYGDTQPFDPGFILEHFPDSIIALWGYNHFADKLPRGRLLVWIKKRPANFIRTLLSDAEICWFNNGGSIVNCVYHEWFGFMRASERGIARVHPAEKPVEIFRRVISLAQIPIGTTIIDCFMGSGPCAVAAIEMGFDFIGIDIEQRYVDAAIKKFANLYARKEKKWSNKQS